MIIFRGHACAREGRAYAEVGDQVAPGPQLWRNQQSHCGLPVLAGFSRVVLATSARIESFEEEAEL